MKDLSLCDGYNFTYLLDNMVYRRTEQYGCIYAIVLYLSMTMYKAMPVFVKELNHTVVFDCYTLLLINVSLPENLFFE